MNVWTGVTEAMMWVWTFSVMASHASLRARCSSLSFGVRLIAVNKGMMGRRCSLKDTRKVCNTWGKDGVWFRASEQDFTLSIIWSVVKQHWQQNVEAYVVSLWVAFSLGGVPSLQQLVIGLNQPACHFLCFAIRCCLDTGKKVIHSWGWFLI